MSTVIFSSRDRLCLKEVIGEEQVLPDKALIELKVYSQITGYKYDMEKDVTLDIQKKPTVNVLTIKRFIV